MDDAQPLVPGQLDRRQVLKSGAVVGGALVWAAPAVQVLGMGTADAASHPLSQIPSHGLLLLSCSTANGAVLVGVKVDEDGSVDGIPHHRDNQGESVNNREFLNSQGYFDWVTAEKAGHTVTGGRTASGDALFLTWPEDCEFVGAWAADGSFSSDGAGLGYRAVTPTGNTVVFTKPA